MRTALLSLCATLCAGRVLALAPGDAAPPFALPWISMDGGTHSTDLFDSSDATVLVLWDRGCPHCAEVALTSPALADSIEPLGAQVVGIVLGPDDPALIADLLWEKQVLVPHLWDAQRKLAGPYGLGSQHLAVFVIDRLGVVRAAFDDGIADLTKSVAPFVLRALASPAGRRIDSEGDPYPSYDDWPALRLDGRVRLLSTEGADPGASGLYGEELQNGTLFLFRWDLRAVTTLASGIEIEPHLRLSNEPVEVLTEGGDRFASRHGSLALRARHRHSYLTLGAFPVRLSPLSLQRWDDRDAPRIGGMSGCSLCGARATGFQQRSLEILVPEYRLEGARAGLGGRLARVDGSIAVTAWERSPAISPQGEQEAGRYRQTLRAGYLELGRSGAEDPRTGLPTPIGIRVGGFGVDDDARSLAADAPIDRPTPRDEVGWVALAGVGPWHGVAWDAELVDWEVRIPGWTREARGLQVGATGDWDVGRTQLHARIHRIQTDRAFEPLYRSLTYERNRRGWRIAAGARRMPEGGGMRERAGILLFLRELEEDEPEDTPAFGRVGHRVGIGILTGRPWSDLVVEAGFLWHQMRVPVPGRSDPTTRGALVDLRWERWPTIEPVLHGEAIRNDPGGAADASTAYQFYLGVRTFR